MKTIEYYDILFEREDTATATATSETDVKQGTVNKFVYYDDTKREVISDGRGGWVYSQGGDTANSPKYLKIENGNGWELGNVVMKITGDIKSPKDALLNILHTGMPISIPMNDSVINDIVAKIENGRAKRGSTNQGIKWITGENGANFIMYATDSGALGSLKRGLLAYSKKHAIKIELANINSLIKNFQTIQSRINAICNTSPAMTVEFAYSVGDSISLCEKANEFIQGLRSSTTPTKDMGSLMPNNKIISSMADEKSNKDSFPNMLKRLTILRKKILEHFSTDDITKENQSKYRDILTALINSNNQTDPDLDNAKTEFANKLSSLGITPEIASDKLYDELDSKLKKFFSTAFETEEEAEATAQALLLEVGKFFNLKLIGETWYKSYVNRVNSNLAHKMECLRKAKELESMPGTDELPSDVETTMSTNANTGDSSIPSYSYAFLYDIKFQLLFDTEKKIPLGKEKTKKAWHSILSRLGKAGWECLGYRPQGYINNIINSYATTRDVRVMVPAALLKGSAEAINFFGKKRLGHDTWFSPNNKQRFQLSKWLREEMQTKGGEVNPEIKKLESGVINIPRSMGNGWRQFRGKETLEKPVVHIDTTNFDGSNIAPERIKYAEAPENKNSGKSGHYKINQNDKKSEKLTIECADGGAQMGGTVSSGHGFFQMPGSISSEGNPIAPTSTQTPFVNGEKTSTLDSGSGDKFLGKINKSKKKKEKDLDWHNKIQSLPDVKSFFDNWRD